MKSFRYRRPSLKTLLGITKAKKRIKKELGITEFMKPFRWWTNTKRQFKRKILCRSPELTIRLLSSLTTWKEV